MNHKNNHPIPNPESQLESGIVAILEEPLDREAIERVKARAKGLSVTVDSKKLEPVLGLNKPWQQNKASKTNFEFVKRNNNSSL